MQSLKSRCHIHKVPSIRVSRVTVMVSRVSVMVIVSGIALNKYRCEYGTRFSRIAYKFSNTAASFTV